MNKFQKLAQLNRDIELLENAGKFDAAEVLQRKFVREAQVANMYNNPTLNKDIKVNRYQNYQNYQTPQAPQAPQSSATTNMYNDPALNKDIKLNRYQEYQTPQGQQQPAAQDNFQNNYTEQSDTANLYQQQNSNPNAQQESIEQKLYMNALNNIENAFKYNDRNTAETIYNKTINEFKNPKRRDLFGKQIQRVRSKYLNPAVNQGPKQ